MEQYQLDGYNLHGEGAVEVATALLALAHKNNGRLQPETVVQAAKSKKSPLHSYFEWTDSKAAEQYRLWQARVLIRSLRVVIEESPELEAQRLFVHVDLPKNGSERQRFYVETKLALRDPVMKGIVLEEALRELQRFQVKYRELTELANVLSVISDTLEKMDGRE
jgi:hypothetical protein